MSKSETPNFTTWDGVDGAGQEILTLQARIDDAKATMNQIIADAKEEHKEAIQDPKRELKLLMEGIEEFVEAHKTELDGRSRQLTHVRVGYRTRPLSLGLRLKSWVKVLERMLGLRKKAEDYIRRTPEVDREGMLAAYKSGKLTRDELQEFGVKPVTGENFFCEAIETAVAEPDASAG